VKAGSGLSVAPPSPPQPERSAVARMKDEDQRKLLLQNMFIHRELDDLKINGNCYVFMKLNDHCGTESKFDNEIQCWFFNNDFYQTGVIAANSRC
jgi:hypothetical protein